MRRLEDCRKIREIGKIKKIREKLEKLELCGGPALIPYTTTNASYNLSFAIIDVFIFIKSYLKRKRFPP